MFFGRDEQITDLASRLRKNRFGSRGFFRWEVLLVRAGLLPELFGGTTHAGQLAQALIETDLYDPDEDIALQVTATLTRRLGLVEAIRQSDLESGQNFLLVGSV